MRRSPQRRNLLTGFIISLLFVTFFIVYSIANMRIVQRERNKVDASLRSLKILEDLMDDMQDIESGQRGYIISGQPEYLAPYRRASADLARDSIALKSLYAVYPDRVPVYDRLLAHVFRKKDLAAINIYLKDNQAGDSALQLIRSGAGRAVMDSIRTIITTLDQQDHAVLTLANEKRAKAAQATALVFIGMSLLFISGLVLVYFRIRRGNKTRESYERRIAYLAGLTEKTSDAIFSTDSAQLIRSWNNGAKEMYGYTAEEAIGKNALELLRVAWDSEEAEKNRAELQQTGHATGEYGAIRKSGDLVMVQASVSLLKDDRGQAEGFVHIHRDITERKKSEHFMQRFNEELAQQVEEKTEQFNNIIERLRDGLYSLDEDFRFNFVNASVQEITGVPVEDMIGKKLLDVFPEAAGLDFYTNLERSFREQIYITQELYYAPLQKWFVVHIYPSENGLTVFSRDITDIKKTEEKLRASNERFEMITRTTNDAVWEWNLETGELWGNETHQQLYGLKPDDPVPTEEEWLSRIHPDDRPGMIHKQEKALSSDANVFITEYRFNTVERGYRNIYDRCYIVRNSENKAIRILGSMMDITERKQAELALQQSEENYRSMIEQASDGIFIMDSEGRYVDTNTAACTLVGYSREEMKGMTAVDVLTPGNTPVPQLKKKELQQGETVILERTLLRKDGSTVDAEVSYKLLSNGNILAIARDITEKKKADEEIVRSNARFQLLSKATSDIVWDWDMRADRIWWNDNYYSLLGLTRTMDMEPIDEWYKRIHPDDVERVRADVQQGIHNHTSFYSHEYRFARADGTYLHFLDRTFILWGADDQPHRMIGSMVNMTPIYEAQRVVAESENRLRTIINSEPQCIKLLDRSGNLLDMNPAGLAMIEADSLEQVKGHVVAAIVDKEYRPGFVQLIEDVFNGRSGSLLFSITGLKGTSRWLETHAVPMKDAAGRIIALLGVTMDVTDKRKAEEELKRNEEKYRTLVEQAVDAIALYDAGGKILDVNTGSVNLLGYSKEELLQMTLPDILTGEEIKQRPVQYDVLQRGESTVKQRSMRRKDGSIVETEVRSQQLPDGRFLSVIRDLTERKKAEYELDQSYKAIRKLTGHIQNVREQERGHIAREIHDELGQQLTVLKMDISWLNKKLGNSDEAIRQKMKGLLAMLDETVKSVRRISSELRPSLLDDLGLVAAMEWQLAEFEKRAGIKTRFQVSGDDVKLPESIKTALFRIFQESLTNVARHSHAKAVSVDFSCEQDQLVLCIEDNGRGFDRQQVAEKRTLGILGMKERTSMIGGTYDISSNPGKGTVVTVMIPFNQYKPTVA